MDFFNISTIHINDYIHIFSNKILNLSDTDDNSGEPYLILGFKYNIYGDKVEDDISVGSRHKFSECNPSCLRALIKEKEPIPLDTMVDSRYAEILRKKISNIISRLVCDCAGTEGLKMLRVVVLIEINLEGKDYVLRELDDVEMMEKENEVCAICLHEMEVGEEVTCTPCVHWFHHTCINRWFEKSSLCPLCRFNTNSS